MLNDDPASMPCFVMIFKTFQVEGVFFESICIWGMSSIDAVGELASSMINVTDQDFDGGRI